MKRKKANSILEEQNSIKLIKTTTPGGIAEARRLSAETNHEKVNYVNKYGETALQKAASKDQSKISLADIIVGHSGEVINKLLVLRLKNAYINEVKTVNSILWDGSFNTTERLCDEIIFNLEGGANKTLAPVILDCKRWVGIIAEKGVGKVNLIYIDSEQQKMPTFLREKLILQIATNYPESQVFVAETKLKSQKFYTNSGVEVIENFLWYLSGCRLPQEKAMELYSWLLKEDLTMMVQNLQNTAVYNEIEQTHLAGVDTQFHFDHW
jgi:hypothetical protein